MGMSRQSVGDRWSGRVPWTIDEVDSLEMIFGLAPGTLMARAVLAMYPEVAMAPTLVGARFASSAPPAGFEPATDGLEVRRSIH